MPAVSPSLIEFQSVEKRYGDGPRVLENLSFTVAPGEFLSFIGPSGCGKSTILKLVAGLSPTTSGTLLIDGKTPAETTQELAFVFQEPTLLPWLTVARNVEVPLALRRSPARERREIRRRSLALVGLADRENAYPRQLSGGQKMRVSLARALSVSPKILLLDEPFGALDEMTRDHLNEELLAIRERESWAALFVTHSVAEAVFLSNRVFILGANPGRIAHEIPIPLPYPRSAATRLSDDYLHLVAHLSQLLRSVETKSLPRSSAA